MSNPFAILISKNENEDYRIVKKENYKVYYKNRLITDNWQYFKDFKTLEDAKKYIDKIKRV